MDYNSKHTGAEVERILDQALLLIVSPAASITSDDISRWNSKQDAITDLEEIREGASKGSTALQSGALDGYATEQYVNSQIGNINTILESIING